MRHLPTLKVAEHAFETLQKAVTAGFDRTFDNRRVGKQEIGRTAGIDDRLTGKAQLAFFLDIQAVDPVRQRQ